MAHLQLCLLGSPQFLRDNSPASNFISNKVPALLVYLAVTRRAHTRDRLAALLWGEMSEADAKNNLRQALTNLRKFDQEALTITRDTVEFTGECFLDVHQFEQDVRSAISLDSETASAKLAEAITLYRADFLEGFHVREAPDFEDWMLTERARLRELALQALHHLTEIQMRGANYPAALETTARLLAFDPWREEAHRQRMIALARAGQRSAALAQYQSCRRTLEKELGVQPSPATTALYEQIRDAETRPAGNLPASITSFVGREAELAEIAGRLQSPDCRVLSLVGEGGVGKSRLALQAAQNQVHQFLGGVWYVPLSEVRDIEGLFLSVASALNLNLSEGSQLREYLQDKNVLLILDGMEHLLDDTILTWITETLQHAPNLKLLVTSLARLNIGAETLLEVRGLPFDRSASSPASKLFIERARQIKNDFNPDEEDLAAIAQLSELVEGAPLALELAAAWVRGLSVPDILKEIERNLDILRTTHQDVPHRHRSMRAVFDHFWQLLSPEEQLAFQKQAVFRGGFTRDAFQEVVDADLAMLSGFVDKSAVHFTEEGRYRRHSLMAQYARLQLRENSGLYRQIRERHARYFSKFVKGLESEFFGGQPQKAMVPFLADLPNIRLAWEWAIEHRDADIFNDMSDSVMQAFDLAGLYRDAFELAVKASAALDGRLKSSARSVKIARGRVMGLAGAFLFRLGDYQESMVWCQRSLEVLEKARPHIAYAHSLVYAGAAAFGLGDIQSVVAHWQSAVQQYQSIHSEWGEMVTSSNLSEAFIAQGDLEAGNAHAERSLRLARKTHNLEQIGASLTNLAALAIQEGQYSEATGFAEEALRSHQKVGHDAHIANSLAVLAKIAFKQNDLKEARRLLEESVGILERVGNRLYLEQRVRELNEVLAARNR